MERHELEITLDKLTAAIVGERWSADANEREGLTDDQQREVEDDLVSLLEQPDSPVTSKVGLLTAWLIRDVLQRYLRTIDASAATAPPNVASQLPVMRAMIDSDLTVLSGRLHGYAQALAQKSPTPRRSWFSRK